MQRNNFTTNVSIFKLRRQVLQSYHMLMLYAMLWCIINISLCLRDCEGEGKLNIYVLSQRIILLFTFLPDFLALQYSKVHLFISDIEYVKIM